MKNVLLATVFLFACVGAEANAATSTQKAALKAERKATAAAKSAAKKADAAGAKAVKLENKAAVLAARVAPQQLDAAPIALLSVGDTIPTPDDFVEIHSLEDADEAEEYESWLLLTPEELAAAKAAYALEQAAEEAAEKAYLASLTSAERAAYKAAEKAADAIEVAADLARIAAEKAAYANMTIAERIAYNDELEAEEQELEDEWIGLTPEQLAIAIAAHQAREAAEHAAEYAAWAAMTPEQRLLAREEDESLDDDPEDAEEIEIEDGDEYE